MSYVDLDLTPHLRDLARELGIVHRQPFTISDDFKYDPILNRFFRHLTSAETPSPNTWHTYSEQISLFIRFLDANEKSWLNVSKDDIRDYYAARRLRPSSHKKNRQPVSSGTWNLAVSALVKLYEWALDEGLIATLPFTRKQAQNSGGHHNKYGQNGRIKQKEKVSAAPLKSIRLDAYKEKFIPALEDARNGQRDVSLANFLITTGLRIDEALSLIVQDLPDPDAGRYAGLLAISLTITGKGNKRRKIKIPKRILRDIQIYLREDRADIVDRWEGLHPKVKPSSSDYPTRVWLTERGTPLKANSVNKLFSAASETCGHYVHPHMLRHTFAVYTLSSLIKQAVIELQDSKNRTNKMGRILRDPLRALQRLMGHQRIETTYMYLDYLEEEEAYVDSALDLWTSNICT